MKFCLRAGHGCLDGNIQDMGAIGIDGTTEYSINAGVVNLLAGKMENRVPYVISPNYHNTEETYNFAKSKLCNFILFIHSNSFTDSTAKGAECFYNDAKYEGYATSLLNYYSFSMGLFHRECHLDAAVKAMEHTDIPILLLELGFVSNPADLQILKTQQSYIADSIMHWILGQCDKTIIEYTFQDNSTIYRTNLSEDSVTLSGPVKIINGRTYIPLSDFGEILEKKTGYLPAIKKITLY